MSDPIRDELQRLNEEFRKLASLPTSTSEETKPEHLTKFGLTLDEAKAWLKQEPNYPSDEILHGNRSDEDFTEPLSKYPLWSYLTLWC
jgi:hypothetical protein